MTFTYSFDTNDSDIAAKAFVAELRKAGIPIQQAKSVLVCLEKAIESVSMPAEDIPDLFEEVNELLEHSP